MKVCLLECDWLTPTAFDNQLKCNNGKTCSTKKFLGWWDDWDCCKIHGGRAKCPKNLPIMCAKRKCADKTDFCCTNGECDRDDDGDSPRPCSM